MFENGLCCQQMARNVYEALNQQLLEDLPKLLALSEDLLMTCMAIFIELMQKIQADVLYVSNSG